MVEEKKHIFPKQEQERILNHFLSYVNGHVLPDENIEMIVLCGSLLKGRMGKYDKLHKLKHFKRLYSDIDLEMFVAEGFQPKRSWKLVTVGDDHVSYYRITKFEGKFPMICRVQQKELSKDIIESYESKTDSKVIYRK